MLKAFKKIDYVTVISIENMSLVVWGRTVRFNNSWGRETSLKMHMRTCVSQWPRAAEAVPLLGAEQL